MIGRPQLLLSTVAPFQAEKKDKQQYIEELKGLLNPKNLSKYLYSFSKRTDLSTVIGSKLDKYVTIFSLKRRSTN